jgi:hypothetical protein
MQLAHAAFPVVAVYSPAVHDEHVATPVFAVNKPTGQGWQELEAEAPVAAL